MFLRKSNEKFKIEIVPKKNGKLVRQVNSKKSILRKKQTIEIVKHSSVSPQYKSYNKFRRAQSSTIFHASTSQVQPGSPLQTRKKTLPQNREAFDINEIETEPERIIEIVGFQSYESMGNIKAKPSELFSNEKMKNIDEEIIRKTTRIQRKITENYKTVQPPKTKSSIRICIDQMNPIHCTTITLKKAPTHTRNMLMPSRSLLTSHSSQRDNRKSIKISRVSKGKVMAFTSNESEDFMYTKKLKSYLDFLFKINYSNRIYVPLKLGETEQNKRRRVYVGPGNNVQLIKLTLRKRFWLEITEDLGDSNIVFYWSQYGLKNIHKEQRRAELGRKYDSPIKKSSKIISNQNVEINKQLLSDNDALTVENFIVSDGYIFPQPNVYAPYKITNHLPNNSCLCQKKKLFKTIFHFYNNHLKADPFKVIPITYSIKNHEDPEFKRFLRDNTENMGSVWIIKPGEDSNRGQGIKLARCSQINEIIQKQEFKTYILQKYILNPLLYNRRKFDIRHFMLVTSVNGVIKAYWYQQGYLRTSSQQFNTQKLDDNFIHLTNDAIQKKSPNYSKFQPANKISYSEFQRYLDNKYSELKINFQTILQKMKKIATDIVIANYSTLDYMRRQSNFQLFGLDFMIDRDFKPWLIEVNTNPSLDVCSHLLERIISGLIEQTVRIALDPLLPPTYHFPSRNMFGLNDHYMQTCKYTLIFDEVALNKSIPIYHDALESEQQIQN